MQGELKPEDAAKAKTHIPRIEAPDSVKRGEPVVVKIHVDSHPNRPEHYIRFIDVYFEEDGRAFNPVHLAHVELAPEMTEPYVELRFRPKLSGTLHVVVYCTTHGLWESMKRIEVRD